MKAEKNSLARLESQRGLFFAIGLVIVLSFTLVAFDWKYYDDDKNDDYKRLTLIEEIEDEIIPIVQIKKPLPPPPPPSKAPPKIIDKIEKKVAIPDPPEVIENPKIDIIDVPDIIDDYIDEPEFFVVVEEMPIFIGCENKENQEAMKRCTDQKIYDFISDNTNPTLTGEAGVDGTVYISFIINEKGDVEDVEVLRGIKRGQLLNREATRVVQSLPKMRPGKQRGKPVKVQYKLPIKFSL